MGQQQDEQMNQQRQGQGKDDQHQQNYNSLAAEEGAELDGEQAQANRQTVSNYEDDDDDEATPRAQWTSPSMDADEFE